MPEKMSRLNKIFHIFGYAIVALCIVFVARQIQYAPSVFEALSQKSILYVIPLWSGAYAVAFLVLAFGWHLILRRLYGSQLNIRNSFYIYTRSSIAKYLPGNIGHLVGRNLVATQYGLPHGSIATSTILELLCQISAAGAITFWADLPIISDTSPQLSFLGTLFLLIVAPVAIVRIGKKRQLLAVDTIPPFDLYWAIAQVCILALLFFLTTGALLYFLALWTNASVQIEFLPIISIYAVSWFIGLITPGAPAGLGVREALMISLLTPSVGASQALVLTVLFRIITTIGDVVFFSFSLIPWLKTPSNTTNEQELQ